ncbi:tetratricopeptide repeat protein, partial [Paenibacillus sepulcri]|nr:tetratricopeptide repeat protein [Paenibacillus sepulcri]
SAAVETLNLDVADFGANYEKYLNLDARGLHEEAAAALDNFRYLLRGDAHNYLQLAADYAGCGLYEEAADVLHGALPDQAGDVYPMLHYTLGYLYGKLGRQDDSAKQLRAGQAATSAYCFPNSLLDMQVLEYALGQNPGDARAHYYLGNLLYDKKRHQEAIRHWEASTELDSSFPTSHRNLALAYFNKQNDPGKARTCLELAYAADQSDARVLYELDQLYKKLGISAQQRLEHLSSHPDQVRMRDDLFVEYVTLHNTVLRHEEAIGLLNSRKFHPWEGGEGKVTGQYVLAHVELGKKLLAEQAYKEAEKVLLRALVYPDNLGEGKLAGAQENNIYYYLGCALEADGRNEEAKKAFRLASQGIDEPAGAMFYNDQPPDTIFYQGLAWSRLQGDKEAASRFNKLIDYGETHLFDKVKLDYFAVSLPDFLVFDDDLNRRNEIHCRYMIGLGHLGLGRLAESQAQLEEVLRLEPNHQGAIIHLQTAE